MTITAIPNEPEPEPDPWARTPEEQAELDERHAVPGYGIRPSAEAQVLHSILSVAISHDSVCQYLEEKVYRQLGIHGEPPAHGDDGPLLDYVANVVEVCAALTPIALRRIPEPVFAKAVAGSGEIESLSGEELEAFLRPMFEEAGIGPRFEVRTGYDIYWKAQQAN